MRILNGNSRIPTEEETPRERAQRGRIEKLEREIEALKKRIPPEPVPLEGKPNA